MKYKKYIFLIFALLCPNLILSQEFLIDSYNKHDGLIQSSVADIIQDENGLIWFYTEQGISAFDGVEFHNYIDSVELFNSWLIKAYPDASGNIYILNLNGQIWRWDKKKFERVVLPSYLIVSDIGISNENELIVTTRNAGIFIFKNGNLFNLTEAERLYSNDVQSITKINNNIFIATSQGLNNLIKDKPDRIFAYNNLLVQNVLIDKRGNLLFGAIKGLFRYNGTLQRIADNITMVEDLCMDRFNNIWIATRSGLYRMNQEGLTEAIVPTSDFRTLLIDREGIIWAGTIGKGVYKIRYNPFGHFTSVNGFTLRMPFPMLEDSNDRIWIGTDHGMIRYANKRWMVINELINKRHITIIEDFFNRIWISTANEIYKYENDKLNLIVDNEILPDQKNILNCKKDGTIIIGTVFNGLWKIVSDDLEKESISETISNSRLYSSFIDSYENLWIGTLGNGAFKISKDKVFHYNSSNGLTADDVYHMAEDDEHNIWLASSNGVYRITQANEIKKYTTEQGLVSNICYSIITYKNYAFVGTSDGLNLIDGESVQVFTTGDGLLNNDCNTNSFMIDKKNNLWIGSIDGISIINLSDLIETKINIGCIIINVKSGLQNADLLTDRDLAREKHFVFQPGDNSIIFTCAGLYYSQNSSLTYTYHLVKENGNIISQSKNNVFELMNSEPGEYKFYVEAKTPAGIPIRSANTILFTIKPFFYQTRLFVFILVVIFIFIGSLFIGLRIYRKKKKIADKYKTSSLTKDKYKAIRQKLLLAFDKEKIYHDNELTLVKLALHLNVHKEHISQVINNEYKKNFNELINSYRIEEAKKILADKTSRNKNILQIAHEIGFNSKNTFNFAFKKQTGLTPTEYRYKHTQD